MKQLVSAKRVKAGNGQAATAARRSVFVQAYMANGQRHPGRGYVGDARVYADIQTRRHTRHTLRIPLPPYVADAPTAMAHGVYTRRMLAILPVS
jgi:hypothetical protein